MNPSDARSTDLIPPASPGLSASFQRDPDAPFWRPRGVDLIRHLGWRNLLFLPAAGTIAVFILGIFQPAILFFFLQVGFKLIVLALAIPVALVAWAIRAAVRIRKEPFCIHCGYGLSGLPAEHVCPECGRPYDLKLLDDYRRDPHWFAQRWRMRHEAPPPGARITVLPNARRRKSRDGT